MKTIRILIYSCCVCLCVACNNNHSQDISGTYICTYQNEYTTGNDTLVISRFNSNGDSYDVERRTGYHKIRNGKTLPIEYKKVKWTATFNKDKQALEETAYGRQIYLAKDQQSLKLGDMQYHRLK